MPRIYVPQLRKTLVFPDNMPRDQIRTEVEKLLANQKAVAPAHTAGPPGAPETDLIGAGISGLRTGAAFVPEAVARISGLVGKAVPGEDVFESGERMFDAGAETIRGEEFVPDTAGEKIVHGLAQAPGMVAAIAPFGAAAAGAVGLTPIAGTLLAAPAIGALSFGAFEALMASKDGLAPALKAGAGGAAMGTLFGGASKVAGLVKNEGLGRLAHAGLLSGIGGGAEAMAGGSLEDIATSGATFALLGAASRGEVPGFRKLAKELGIPEGKSKGILAKVKEMNKAGKPQPEIAEYIEKELVQTWTTTPKNIIGEGCCQAR